MEAAAARKAVDRLDDPGAGLLEARLRLRDVVGVEDDQRPAARARLAEGGEAAFQAAIGELAIIGTVIG